MSDLPIQYRIKEPSKPGPNCMWRIDRPDLGMVGEGYIFEVLARNVADWRRANGIPIGLEFEHDLEQAICAQHPALCESDDPRAPVDPRALKYNDVLTGTRVMITQLKGGRQIVSQEEAERRAGICAHCRFNVNYAKPCGGVCGALLAIWKTILGTKTTSRDSELNACYFCGCSLRAAVWIDRDLQWNALNEFTRTQFLSSAPPACWKAFPK